MIMPISVQRQNYVAQKATANRMGASFQDCMDSIDVSGTPQYDPDSLLTEAGKNSKGGQELTNVQKQYLRDKYDLSTLTDRKSDTLLAELTNMGVLSYRDYRLSHLCCGKTGVFYIGELGDGKKNWGHNFAAGVWESLLDMQPFMGTAEKDGKDSFADSVLYSSKRHIFDALQTLDPQTCGEITRTIKDVALSH
jgi:hypothetical protein